MFHEPHAEKQFQSSVAQCDVNNQLRSPGFIMAERSLALPRLLVFLILPTEVTY